MIDLVFLKGNVFVWNADDWLQLRQQYRIIGGLIGCLTKFPRQENLHGLPLILQPEEVTLLLENKIARLVEYPDLLQKPSDDLRKTFEDYRNRLISEQEKCLIEGRKEQLMKLMDQIVDGKRRKILGLGTSKKKLKKPVDFATSKIINEVEIDRDALLAEEIKKIPKLEPTEALVQIHTAYPWAKTTDIQEVEWNYPESAEDKLRYRVFKDLWNRGYHITLGEKFGCDFLVYPGDPVMFHSLFAVQCKNRNESLKILDVSAQCRVACHVRKSQIYAFLSEDEKDLMYQSFYFEPSNMID